MWAAFRWAFVCIVGFEAWFVTGSRLSDFFDEAGHKPVAAGKESLEVSEEEQLRTLMIRYQGGSLEAFQGIYAQFAAPVRRYLSHLAGGSQIADDLLQETFLQMHRPRAAYNPLYPIRPGGCGLAG